MKMNYFYFQINIIASQSSLVLHPLLFLHIRLSLTLSLRLMNKSRRKAVENILKEEKERCSGSYRLAVGFLVIKDESISERPG
jgi:hypothetical protein